MDKHNDKMRKERASLSKKTSVFRIGLWGAIVVFCLISCIYFVYAKDVSRVLMSLGSVILVSLPFLALKLFCIELNSIFFVFCMIYAIGGPMLGYAYKLFYYLTWWDDLLHISAGVVFAVFGTYFAKLINGKNRTSILTCALFALCFSIALSAVWELVEYGIDVVFGADMQNDTVITSIDSFLLGDGIGERGSITNIEEVVINGVPLNLGGYVDIGLIDTMNDMLVESFGALAFVVFYLIDKEKHPLIKTYKKSNIEEPRNEISIESHS